MSWFRRRQAVDSPADPAATLDPGFGVRVSGDLYVAERQEFFQEAPAPFTLDPLGPASRPDPDAGPSQWLLARYELVPFTGGTAHTELGHLGSWLRERQTRSVRLITGRGGQGKSRLALELARQAQAERWHVLVARTLDDGPLPPQLLEDGSSAQVKLSAHTPDSATGVLVLVDYADRWQDQPLRALLDHPDLAISEGRPVRVLLLARSGLFWPALRDVLDERGYRNEQRALPTLPDDSPACPERADVYRAAYQRFAADLPIPPDVPRLVPELEAPGFDLTLTVHMAALAAVLAETAGDTPPTTPADITGYLLDRERRHWRRIADRKPGTRGLGEQELPRVVFLAGLVQRTTRRQAVDLLTRDGFTASPQLLLDLHSTCYPASVPGTVLEPLLPDRLAEDYAAGLLIETSEQYDATCRDLSSDLLHQPETTFHGPAMTLLTESATRHPTLSRDLLAPYLAESPDLALSLSGSTLARLVDLPGITHNALDSIRRALREAIGDSGTHTGYALGMAATVDRLTTADLPATHTDSERAYLLADHAYWLGQAGRREEALAPAEEAAGIRRRLAEANPAAYLPDLARSLNNLGTFFSEVGRREEALAPAEEAAGIYRRLAEANPAAYLPDLASALNNLGNCFSEVGRREEALAPAEEAAGIYRRLAEANPAAYLPDLAMSLNNLGIRFSEVGRREEALAPAEEAAGIYRRLAEANPAAYLPDLASALNNLGIRFSEVGRREEALAPAEEAAGIYRRLAEANPAAYLPDLASALNNLGIRFSQVGRREEALAPAEEAAGIRRRLAEANPAAYLPDLASALNNLGIRFSQVGRREEALAPAEEAAGIRRRLAEANPAAYLPALASALNNLGIRFSEVGRREEALAPAEEAAGIYRRLAEANPAAYLPDLAMSLNNLGIRFSEVGRREEALAPAEEAAGIRRRLAEANPAAYLPALAMSLNNLGTFFSEVGRREEALAPAEEAAGIYRRLAEANPAAYLPDLAMSLNNLGIRFSKVGRREEALAPAEEAAGIYRRLAEANPAAYLPALAMSLNNLGTFFSEVGRREEALAPAEEAAGIYRRLAEANPAAYLPDLAMSLNNLGIRFSKVGRREEALAPAEEAAGIYRRLAEANPAAYLPDLAMSLWGTAWICDQSSLDPEIGVEAGEEAVEIYRRLAQQMPQMYERLLQSTRETVERLRITLGRT